MLQPLDGPSLQTTLSVGTGAVVEAKVGGSVMEGRKVLTLYSDKKFYVYWGDGTTTPSVSDLQDDGILFPKKSPITIEATDSQPVFLLSDSGTADIQTVERG